MFQVRSSLLIGLCLAILLCLLLMAGLAGAQWEPANSPANDFANQIGPAPEGQFGFEGSQGFFRNVLTETVYLPIASKMPTGEWIEVWADEQRTPILRSLADSYKQAHGVDLVVKQVANIPVEIMNKIPAGSGPDIFMASHDRLGLWLEEGLVTPIDLGTTKADFAAVSLDGFTSGGKLYGMPFAFENMGLFRNLDLVPDTPLNWAEVLAVGQALQASGKVSYTLALENNGYKVYPILTSFGGYVFGREVNGTWDTADLGIDGPGMIAAGAWISDSVGAGLISPIAHGSNDAERLFESGRVPFIMTGPWSLERFQNSEVNYAISSFPDDGLPFVGVQGFLMSAYSTKQQLAQTFLTDFVATAEIMERLYQSSNRPPAYLPLLGSINDPDLTAFFEAGKGAEVIPAIPDMGCVWGPWNNAVIKIITGAEKPDEAFTGAAQVIRECITGAYAGMVNVPGSYQTLVGCDANWDPACLATAMTEGVDGLFTSSFVLPAGTYECKVALNGNWTENYGLGGIPDGPNIPFSLASSATVAFSYDPDSHILTVTIKQDVGSN